MRLTMTPRTAGDQAAAAAQGKALLATVDRSAAALSHQRLFSGIASSPRQVAQRQRLRALQPAQPRTGPPVLQRVRSIEDVLNFINKNREALNGVGSAHLKRLLHANEMGAFDVDKGGFDLKVAQAWINKRTPEETAPVDGTTLPRWMRARMSGFGLDLPRTLGGGKLNFRARPGQVVFEGRGWISENVYWRSPSGVEYMIHAILEWAGQVDARGEPTPHITLRDAVTQAKIDLDRSHPLPQAKKGEKPPTRIQAELEASASSYSKGLGTTREPGRNMKADENTFAEIDGPGIQVWLKDLIAAAQGALG